MLHTLHPRVRTLPSMLMAAALAHAGCASGRSVAIPPPERLVVENTTADVIRLFVQVEDRVILIGRVLPMQRASLRIAPGSLPPGSPVARIVAVPVGAPTAVMAGAVGGEAPRSEPYRMADLIAMAWRYSGGSIVSIGPKR